MKTIRKLLIAASAAILTFSADLTFTADTRPPSFELELDLVSEAQAVYGRQRRTRRRGAAVGYEAGKAAAEAENTAQEQAPPPQQQAPPPQQQAPPPQQQAAPPRPPPPAPAAAAPAIGSVVKAPPAGSSPITMGGVEYQRSGNTYYRAAFQGDQLVYVVSQP